MKTDLSKIAVVIIADKNGKMMQRFSPNSYMTQGSVMTIRTECEDVANGVDTRTEPALPIQSVSFPFNSSVMKLKKLMETKYNTIITNERMLEIVISYNHNNNKFHADIKKLQEELYGS